MFMCVFSFTTGPLYMTAGLSLRPSAEFDGAAQCQGCRDRPQGQPSEPPSYPLGRDAIEVRSPTTLHLHCAESVEGRNPESIPDTNMEKSLFGANIRANIILPERNHGEHL